MRLEEPYNHILYTLIIWTLLLFCGFSINPRTCPREMIVKRGERTPQQHPIMIRTYHLNMGTSSIATQNNALVALVTISHHLHSIQKLLKKSTVEKKSLKDKQ